MIRRFDPNDPRDAPDHPWGTARSGSAGSHRGTWKTHARLRDVRAALDATNGGISVWRKREDGLWEKVLDLEPREGIPVLFPSICHVCKQGRRSEYEFLYACWSPDHDFKKVVVHYDCGRKLKVRRG
jgi:hypothetical protein